ncbi:UNVERIFIED_CONTAM: hypothetical protein Sradi_6238700 [Sesamum radiatum]|uniref:DUF4283 domain-containing protein n=1 Tax=Sesamum radiatum TaxID=300843 RepID=A0AAW2KA34_SESRA
MGQEGSQKHEATVSGYFLGRKSPFHQVNSYFCSVWPAIRDVIATVNGFSFIQFKTCTAIEEVSRPTDLCSNDGNLVCHYENTATQVPVWIKLCHLSVEVWTPDGLKTIARRVGLPLCPDAIMKACTRLDFALVCVMLDFDSILPKHLVILVPRDDGRETPCRMDVEYNWVSAKRLACRSLGHQQSRW